MGSTTHAFVATTDRKHQSASDEHEREAESAHTARVGGGRPDICGNDESIDESIDES